MMVLTRGLQDEGDQGCGDVGTQLDRDKWGLGMLGVVRRARGDEEAKEKGREVVW